MTDQKIERVWRMTDMFVNRAEGLDSAAVELQSEGRRYAVVMTGHEGMSVTQMTDALRAALFYLLRAGSADPELMKGIGARTAEPGEFDTNGKSN